MSNNPDNPRPHTGSSSPVSNRNAVRVDGVSKNFGDVVALQETTFTVAKGEFLTLLGPSGCGKSTILNLVAGFLTSDRGEIFLDGKPITTEPAFKRDIGIVFQNYALFPHMTVAKNIGYGLQTRGVGKAQIARRVGEALELVKLPGYGSRMPRELSGGQQQRIALARALIIQPKVLLLDEPFSALDKNLRSAMQVELKEIQRALNVSTIFVTHDQGEALSMSDRIAVMSAGRIRQMGDPALIYRHPADRFVASFVGETNEVEATFIAPRAVAIRGTVISVSPDAVAGLMNRTTVDVFVRPEELSLATHGAAGTIPATVAANVYQGGYTDVYVRSDVSPHRILVRVQGPLNHWPEGSPVGLKLPDLLTTVFPKSSL